MKLYFIAFSSLTGLVSGRIHGLPRTRVEDIHKNTRARSKFSPARKLQPSCDHDAIVAGLGWAGIGALYEFQLFNEQYALQHNVAEIDYLGIETAGFYGGRIISGELVSGGEKNPIGQLIGELFSQNPNNPEYLLHSSQSWFDIYYYDLQAQKVIPQKTVNQARNNWNDAYECSQRVGNEGPQANRSLYDVLKDSCEFNPDTIMPLESLFMWYELAWEFVLDPENMSAKGNVPLWTYYLMQDKDWFVTAPRNLATVADKAVRTYIPDYNNTAQLNTKVDEISNYQAGPCVNVKTDSSGTAIKTEKALITFSVGVLAENTGLFNPPLIDKIGALRRTFYLDSDGTMGQYKLLFVQLSEDAWDQAKVPNNEFIFAVPSNSDEVGKCTMWQSFDRYKHEFFDESRSFACTLVTEAYKNMTDPITYELDDCDAQSLIAKLFDVLELPYTGTSCPNNPDPGCLRVPVTSSGCSIDGTDIDFFLPDIEYPWDNNTYSTCAPGKIPAECVYQIRDGDPNPNWKGAWSTFIPEWEEDDYDEVRANVQDNNSIDRLYFAGEAMNPIWVGFQHGAWDSGRLKAREMIYSLRGLDEAEQEVWKGISDSHLTAPRSEIPTDGDTPVKKSKTIP